MPWLSWKLEDPTPNAQNRVKAGLSSTLCKPIIPVTEWEAETGEFWEAVGQLS